MPRPMEKRRTVLLKTVFIDEGGGTCYPGERVGVPESVALRLFKQGLAVDPYAKANPEATTEAKPDANPAVENRVKKPSGGGKAKKSKGAADG